MKIVGVLLICTILASRAFAAAPNKAPATGPKEGEDTLLDGAIIFTPPEGWQELTRDAKSIQYNSPDHKATIMVTARPQEVNINKDAADQMGMMIKKKIAEQVKSAGGEFVISPRVEKDDLLLLKVHDRTKSGGAVADRVQLYNMVSLNLVTVISVVSSDVEDEINSYQKTAGEVLRSARFQKLDPKSGKRVPVKPKMPTTLPKNYWKAHVRILGPTGWKEEMKDNTTGEIATFTDPQHADVTIHVTIDRVPAGVSEDDPRIEKLADDMIDRQEQADKKAGREAQGESEVIDDPAYVKKSRTRYAGKAQPTVVSSRVLQLDHILANIVTEAPADQSPRVEKLADEWAKENITPMGSREIQRQERMERSATQPRRPELPAP